MTMMKVGQEVLIVGGSYKGQKATLVDTVGKMSVLLELKKDKKRVKIRQWNVAIAGGETKASDEDTQEQPLPSPPKASHVNAS